VPQVPLKGGRLMPMAATNCLLGYKCAPSKHRSQQLRRPAVSVADRSPAFNPGHSSAPARRGCSGQIPCGALEIIPRLLGGRGHGLDIKSRAPARFLSPWFTRAKSSSSSPYLPLPASTGATTSAAPFSHSPLGTSHRHHLPGSVHRVESHVSHTKQTTATRPTRNVPVRRKLHLSFASLALQALTASRAFPIIPDSTSRKEPRV
jgi:hypothetical protein